MTRPLHRWTVQAQHQQLSNAIQDTLLPVFGGIGQKAQEFSQELQGMDCSSDDPCHSEDEYRAAQEAYFEDGLRSIEAEMAGMAVVALYHLWERSVKTLLSQKCSPDQRDKIAKADFDMIKNRLKEDTLPSECKGALKIIDLGRLIANVIKHGEGHSAVDLRDREPGLFTRPWNDEDFPLPSNHSVAVIWPQPVHAQKLANAIADFWKHLPDRYFPARPGSLEREDVLNEDFA